MLKRQFRIRDGAMEFMLEVSVTIVDDVPRDPGEETVPETGMEPPGRQIPGDRFGFQTFFEHAASLLETDLTTRVDAVIDDVRDLDEVAFIGAAADTAGHRFVLLAVVLDTARRLARVTGRRRWCVVLAQVVAGEPEVAAIHDPIALAT